MPRTSGPNYYFYLYFLVFLVFIITVNPLTGQIGTNRTWMTLTSSEPAEAEIILQYSDIETSRVEFQVGGFWREHIRNMEGVAEEKMYLSNSTPMLIKGAPDLDKLTISLIIPDRSKMQVFIIEEEYVDIPDIHIIPSKGNLTRDINPADVPYEYGREYRADAFFPGVAAELRTPHIIRDVRGQVMVIYPFRYNPVQKILRVYTRLVVEVKAVGDDGENLLTVRREDVKTVRAFEGIYERRFLNYNEYRSASRYVPLEEDGNMLVISYGAFMADMQDFVDWKNMSGIPTEIVDVSSIGTTASQIKTYVANYYNTSGLTFLLLVGDAAQVPTSSTSAGDSDNDYGYIVGNDHYPDVFVGRFSAESVSHVQTQVLRTLNYEKMPDAAPGYYQRAMCIASAEGTGDDEEYDWQHQRNIRTKYMNYTYTYGAELYDGSQGGEDATGNPTAAMVAGEINTGTGIISYTGHGSTTNWSTSGFSNTNINSLTNNSMLPFIISVACVNGNFVSTTCFAEAWLRATHNGDPSGAVATIMSTINQTWSPPMRGQDEMVDILVETYPNNIKRTFGGICMNGCMNMNDEYGAGGEEMTDTWTIFGDPSLMVRTAAPAAMTVTFPGDLPVGSDQVTVNCDQEGARVAVSKNYQLLGSGIVSNGSANVFFGQINQEDTLTVTVTAFNCLPVIDTLIITNQDMAFVSSTAFHGNLGELAPGEQDAEALGVEVLMSGSQNPFDLLSLTFNMNGTTDLSDVTALKVYYTGSSSTFGTSNLFGTGAVSAGSITITGAQALTGWVNHFWLAYDIDAAAAIGNMIDAECTGLIISDSSLVTRTPDITAPSGSRLINDGMELTVLTTTQPNTQTVASGDQNVDIICVEVTTTGTPLPLQVNSLTISTSGTTDLNDISSIKVYYTASATFNTNELYGTAAPGSEVVITGIKILNEGINYFWVAYDVASGAGPGNHLDAGCTEVVFAGVTGSQVPSVTHPAGYRQVELNYCIPTYNSGTGAGDYISLVNLNTLYNATGASPSPFYTYYQDVATHLVPGNTYDLIVSPGSYSSGNHIAAWIDFNRNGIFEPAEKLGEANNISPMPATATITFPVPSDATVGMVRLRVREVYSTINIDPCNNYNYGEAEDYNVHIMLPGCWLGHTNEWNNPANWSDGTVPG
ncbi:MAG: C25 family cysteine peptidase, partial [Bacteroidales bacterium]